VLNLLVESSSQFGESENKNADDGYPMKAIEKLVLRFLGSHTFSHGLDPKPPFPDTPIARDRVTHFKVLPGELHAAAGFHRTARRRF
jgi:hypothetical protein